jgi:hypothetical protein
LTEIFIDTCAIDNAGKASKTSVGRMDRLQDFSSIFLLRIRAWETAMAGA